MASFIKASLERSYAESFLAELERGDSQYFLFIGKSTPWTNDNSPPTYTDSVGGEYEVMNSIIAYKKLSPRNVLFALPRYEWASGTVYDQYSDTVDLFDENDPKQFFVVTDQNNIYKCISNNGGAGSTEKPTQTLYSEFTLSDGYIWKYLATVRESDLPYELTDYIPVDYASISTDTETTNQYNVQTSSVSGALTRIESSNAAGASAGVYPNTVVSGSGSSSIATLRVSAYNATTKTVTITDAESRGKITDNTTTNYIGYALRINYSTQNPAEINNYGIITSLVRNPNDITITVQDDVIPFVLTAPTVGSNVVSVEITPHILVRGDGSGAYAKPRMISQRITGIDLVGKGEDYSVARAEVVSRKETVTVHPTLTPVVSPKGGHGSNILKELNVKDIIIIVSITEEDADKFIGGGSYRQFGIIKNPLLSDGSGQVAGSDRAFFRDITLKADSNVSTTQLNIAFDGSPANALLGSESFCSAKVDSLKSAQTPITVKVQNSVGAFVTYNDRKERYRLELTRVSQFLQGETVRQTIPAGTVSTGISYGYDYIARGTVISQSGSELKIQLQTTSGFVAGVVDLIGDDSGFTADINSVEPQYGEYIWVTNGAVDPALVNIDGDNQFFRVIDVGPSYFDTNLTPSYTGLTILDIATSTNTPVGGVDTTTSTLTANSFSNGDSITQGATGTYTQYATGTVYNWDFVNPSYGRLYITNVIGQFRGVDTHGLTGTTLGAYIVASVTPPDILPASGEVLYIDNVRPIQRSVGQEEEFRIRLGF